MERANVYIISTGTELSTGRSVDTNAPWIATRVVEQGFNIAGIEIIPDDPELLLNAIELLVLRDDIDILIMTGGLGPTDDDHTVDVLAALTKFHVYEDPTALHKLQERLNKQKSFRFEDARRQTRVLSSVQVLPNERGLAPGMMFAFKPEGCDKKSTIACMPGVPREMELMFEEHLLPKLVNLYQKEDIERRVLYIYNVGESSFQSDFFGSVPNTGTRSSQRVSVTTSSNFLRSDVKAVVSSSMLPSDFRWGITAVHGYLKVFLESTDGSSLDRITQLAEANYAESLLYAPAEELFHELAIEQKVTVGTAESCTGGLVGKVITDHTGSSKYYKGGVVSYSNEIKESLLNVPSQILKQHGAVSAECAEAMAVGVRKTLSVDWALATTGIAGPEGGSEQKPVGTVYIALAGPGGTLVQHIYHPLDRGRIRLNTVYLAIFHLYKFMQSHYQKR